VSSGGAPDSGGVAGGEAAQSNGATARHAAEPTVGQLVADASEQVSALVRAEMELAKLELKASLTKGGIGAGSYVIAIVVFCLSLIMAMIAAAEGLHTTGLDLWACYLIVFGVDLIIVAVLIMVGTVLVKRVQAPTRTIQTSKDTVEFLKTTVNRG
jgi:hypothetical protein